MGATCPPTWVAQPLIFEGDPLVLEENMPFFTRLILSDRKSGLSMAVAGQAIITRDEPEIITHVPGPPTIRD